MQNVPKATLQLQLLHLNVKFVRSDILPSLQNQRLVHLVQPGNMALQMMRFRATGSVRSQAVQLVAKENIVKQLEVELIAVLIASKVATVMRMERIVMAPAWHADQGCFRATLEHSQIQHVLHALSEPTVK